MKSELHLNQDGVKTGDGTATLPVKDFFLQIIAGGQAGGDPHHRHGRAACSTTSASATWSSPAPPGSGCDDEFRNETFNHTDVHERLGRSRPRQLDDGDQR